MKHIVFLEQYGSFGGGQQVLLELVRAALHTGFQATVLIPEGPCADRLRSLGAQVMIVSECRLSQGKKNLADIFRFAWYGCRAFLSHRLLLREATLWEWKLRHGTVVFPKARCKFFLDRIRVHESKLPLNA